MRNYGGDANTIHQNSGIPLVEAKKIYNNYMSGFKGVSNYQNFRRLDWLEKGYILLNGRTRHKAFIYEDKSSYTVQKVQKFFKRKSKQSINYPIK